MASYRSLPAQNPFEFDSDDSEHGHIYDDDVDINIDIEDDGITVDEGTTNRNTANNTFNNDPFYKNLFHEIDSSNSDGQEKLKMPPAPSVKSNVSFSSRTTLNITSLF